MSGSEVMLGVDVGGTKTDALVVARDGIVVGRVRGPGANHEAIGWDLAAARIRGTVEHVLHTAGVSARDVVASGWGISGLDWPADEAMYRSIVGALSLGGPSMVVNDAFLALEAGNSAAPGVAVVSGTGVLVVGRAEDGTTARTLGVGAGRGEWGSAGDVVRAAAVAVAQQHMRLGPLTALTEVALQRSKVGSAGAYCEEVWRHGRAHLLPPDVWDVAAAGDPVAEAIANRVADSLAAGVGAVAQRLHLRACDVLLAGRVLDPGHPVLHTRLVAALSKELPGGRPRPLGVPPVIGAVMAGARLAGWTTGAHDWHLSGHLAT